MTFSELRTMASRGVVLPGFLLLLLGAFLAAASGENSSLRNGKFRAGLEVTQQNGNVVVVLKNLSGFACAGCDLLDSISDTAAVRMKSETGSSQEQTVKNRISLVIPVSALSEGKACLRLQDRGGAGTICYIVVDSSHPLKGVRLAVQKEKAGIRGHAVFHGGKVHASGSGGAIVFDFSKGNGAIECRKM